MKQTSAIYYQCTATFNMYIIVCHDYFRCNNQDTSFRDDYIACKSYIIIYVYSIAYYNHL